MTPFHENMKVNTAGGWNEGIFPASSIIDNTVYQGFATDSARMNVKDVRFEIVGSDLKYEAVFTPTSEFTSFIESLPSSDKNYGLWVSPLGSLFTLTQFLLFPCLYLNPLDWS